ncbi:tyrosine-type recombinase/integrase [Nocardia farcinica]|uniref:tyrosine-type recombinase/integrase n=1 Tax=Nocardia farcinica TaxID=37329 RepID=UPI002B4B1C38|nr:tyrosine-type recombinase/integrase [Nocardia farcinica]
MAYATAGVCRSQRLALSDGRRTWTVLGRDHRPVGPAEEYLEYLRVQRKSPNTVKSYARALALWWEYLAVFGLRWDAVTLESFGGFLTWLRTGADPEVVELRAMESRFAESTIAVRLRAVLSCYTYHQLNGVEVGGDLYRITHGRNGNYKPLLEHIARRSGRRQAVIRVRRPRRGAPPMLTPGQIDRICQACAWWEPDVGEWRGSVRNRLLWSLLADTGMRLGEALGLQHRDWHTGRGDTASVEIVARDDRDEARAKSGHRRIYISDQVDRLYGEYVWQLCELGADLATDDFDATYVFVNLEREPRFAPWKPESVYDLVDRLRRQLAGQVPDSWSPHWMRHSHATALLLSGVPAHVVSRRLGHADVQTTLSTYAHVTEDAELRAVADWSNLTAGWLAAQQHSKLIGPC